jgi:magnesium transporter
MAPDTATEPLTLEDLRDVWHVLSPEDRAGGFRLLPRADAEELFLSLPAADQAELLRAVPRVEQRSWIRLLAPDDAADLLQEFEPDERGPLLELLDDQTRRDVRALLAYRADAAGGLMSPRFARLRPEMTADEAITYLRRQARERLETIYYLYVLDDDQRLLGVVSFRDLFAAQPGTRVHEIMRTDPVMVRDDMDQEAVSRVMKATGYLALPVVGAGGRLEGIVTVDDIVDVVEEEATEDIQKLGGMEALGAPYLKIGFREMVGKRAGWLAILFVGELLTATAMARYEDEIARAVVLALFVPLIISSGGNSGSQATTLVIRAMALGEVRLRDWWRVMRRELGAGVALGATLGALGFLRIVIWEAVRPVYGPHYLLVAATVFLSLVGVVTFGTLAGSLLPFLLRSLRLDPASASAPFVATLVDVTGLVIYFTTASMLLSGTLL